MTADRADHPSEGRRPDDRRREQHAHNGSGRNAPPGAVAGARLVLVLMDLAVHVLGDEGGIVGADQAVRMSLLDDLVVLPRCSLVRIRRHENERAVGL